MAFLRSEDKIRQLVEILCGISELWSSSYYSELIMQSKSESVSHSVVLWVTLGDPRFLNSMEKSMEFSSKNTGAGCHSHLQGIFLIQGLKLSLLHCRQFLYHLSHQGSPAFPELIPMLTKSAKSLQPWGFYSSSKKQKIIALQGAYIFMGKEVMIGGGERQK